jgi:cell filamentation protein
MNRYDYEFERVDAYCYHDTYVLKNKFDIRDAETLSSAEREFTSAKIAYIKENPIKGKFDLKHLRAIHRYIFCDIYEWAGELRTVNIAKGNQFCNYIHLETYADGIFSRLKAEKLLENTRSDAIAERLAYYLSEINVLHPFREGNGRVQRVFIEYLAQIAGWYINFADISDREMIEASALAYALEYDKMEKMFRKIIAPITSEEQNTFCAKVGLKR